MAEAKKENFFARTGKRISRWFREMKSELTKVMWPTKKTVVNNTLVALVVMAFSAVVLWGFDKAATALIKAITTLAG